MTQKEINEIITDIELKLEHHQSCLLGIGLGEHLDDQKTVFMSGDTDELLMIISKAIAVVVDGKTEDVERVMKDIHLYVMDECYQESVRKVMEK